MLTKQQVFHEQSTSQAHLFNIM